jgi:hypothetical protein
MDGEPKTPPRTDYYVVGTDVRTGVYPGATVRSFPTHWEAVADMMRRGDLRAEFRGC